MNRFANLTTGGKRRENCGKICFTKKDARTKRNWLLKKGRADDLRIYPCPDCFGAWHLTKT